MERYGFVTAVAGMILRVRVRQMMLRRCEIWGTCGRTEMTIFAGALSGFLLLRGRMSVEGKKR